MPAPTARRLRVSRDINDYSVVAHEPGKAPYTVAGYIVRREDARLFARAEDMRALLQRIAETPCDHGPAPFCPHDEARALLARIDKGRA